MSAVVRVTVSLPYSCGSPHLALSSAICRRFRAAVQTPSDPRCGGLTHGARNAQVCATKNGRREDGVRAIQMDNYGGPEVLKLGEAPTPEPGPGEVRVKAAAVGVNPADFKWRQ